MMERKEKDNNFIIFTEYHVNSEYNSWIYTTHGSDEKFVQICSWKIILVRCKHRLEDNIKMDLKDI
jgi:hypothetical protein